MIHYLKTWPDYFDSILAGVKTFEIRKNDRNFQVGDILVLQEYEPEEDVFSGDIVRAEVTYVFEDDGTFGLMEGYCIMAIKRIK